MNPQNFRTERDTKLAGERFPGARRSYKRVPSEDLSGDMGEETNQSSAPTTPSQTREAPPAGTFGKKQGAQQCPAVHHPEIPRQVAHISPLASSPSCFQNKRGSYRTPRGGKRGVYRSPSSMTMWGRDAKLNKYSRYIGTLNK